MRITAIVLLILSLTAPPARAQSLDEGQIKAAFVLNFIRFTEFSTLTSDQKEIEVCIISSESIFSQFRIIEDKEAHGRSISLTSLPPDALSITECKIIFVSSSRPLKSENIKNVTNSRALTIGEQEDFIEQGGIIRFYLDEGKIRFEISPNNAADAQIHLSSKLLSIAKINNGDEI